MPDGSQPHDVRMRGFARRTPVADVTQYLRAHVGPLAAEQVDVLHAAGRVLAQSISSTVDVPGFARGMMDGYAVRAVDTSGAAAESPRLLTVIAQSMPGHPAEAAVGPGQAIRIMTGAPVPVDADAVVPVESTCCQGDRLTVLSEVTPGKHVAVVGEDIARGTQVLAAGRRLRPQDIGVLTSIGVSHLDVVRSARVHIVVTGNELLPPGSQPHGAQIVDSNSPMLAALIRRDGGIVHNPGIVPDDPELIRQALADDADVVLVSGGSSVGQEDHAPRLLAGDGDLIFHGIAMRPGSPTGLGRLRDRWVFLLPGNPVSCLWAYDLFAGPVIRRLGARSWDWPYRAVRGRLGRQLVSAVGRVDYVRVQRDGDRVEPLAISGASILSSTTRADGFLVVPQDLEGYGVGADVDVYLYDD